MNSISLASWSFFFVIFRAVMAERNLDVGQETSINLNSTSMLHIEASWTTVFAHPSIISSKIFFSPEL
jgi:hypothetical protein